MGVRQPHTHPVKQAAMIVQPGHFIPIAEVLVLLSGFIPLTQTTVVGGRGYDHFGYYGEMRSGLLQIGPSNRKRTATVIPNKSYATAPDGTRHGISTEPHLFDIEEKDPRVPYVRERIYVLD